MFLAADLDRTLIYSKKVIELLNGFFPDNLYPVEIYKGESFSFITQRAAQAAHLLLKENLLVPVTTRTRAQYRRVALSSLTPRWAITCNGAVVLNNGDLDHEYDNYVKSEVAQTALSLSDMEAAIDPVLDASWLIEKKYAESWFLYLVIDRDLFPSEVLTALQHIAIVNKWQLSVQGRTLYLIPDCINKQVALRYVCQRTGHRSFIGAGDSLLDQSVLEDAKIGFIPSHGELYNRFLEGVYTDSNLSVIQSKGVYAGEEILVKAVTMLSLLKQTAD